MQNQLETMDNAELRKELALYRASQIGGVFSARMDAQFTLLYGNDLYFEVQGYEPEELLGKSCAIFIHPQDLPHVQQVLTQAQANHQKNAQWEMRIFSNTGELKYLLVSGSFNERNGEAIFDGYIIDLSEQKRTEQALRASEEKFRIATENSDISFWTYDFKKRAIIQTASSQNHHGFQHIIENVPESIIESGHIRKDSQAAFLDMYRQLWNGAKTVSGDFWTFNNTKQLWWCEHIDYTNIFDESGAPLYAYAVGRDITASKIAEKRYLDEVAYAQATQSANLLAKVRSNLTQDYVESYSAQEGIAVGTVGTSYTDCAEALAQTAFTPEERAEVRKALDRKRVLQAFNEGDISYNVSYRRRIQDNRVIWVNTTVKSFEKPETGDIMSFMYSYDINEEKIKEGIIQSVTALEYDFIAYIDLKNDTLRLYMDGDVDEGLLLAKSESYSQSVITVNQATVAPEDLERSILEMSPDGIIQNLKKQPVFSTVYAMYDNARHIRQKRVQYSYLDAERGLVLCTRSDITELLAGQKQQQNLLEAALLAAEQANSAKSDFLSRMSHEIRTPMNAIIGMSAIAAQSIGDDAQVSDCISKIGISSRFLLTLINDILDMSRIESGKMLLKNEKIPFDEFLNGINTICYTQAQAKDLDYENIVDPNLDDYYMGDAMKLQQVIINILSNAVKFTPHHGKVSLRVCPMRKDKSNAIIRFIINDTGCGISETFMPKLFEPFSQEHLGTTAMYSGTGLGLAICKNLVDMMDGHIDVRSIVGVGSEFTVDVKLGITEESRTRYLNKPHFNFAQLKALVVDDDVAVCEHAVITLKEIGVTSEWVDSGKKAVDRVRYKWEKKQYYDLVLVDWKMPGMDGIETARQIRKIVGPEVTIIIMTAYDWSSIEHDAKLAGVNLLMSKPMFKSSLISAFEKVLAHQDEAATQITEEVRFDGKRVLLAEDHALNVEVATRLLNQRGFMVEHAENGLRALELFTGSAIGYYDAILMDIRMPQMDGLQATYNIRHWSRPDAKTIPIIAMTANAFEEDIEKSKAAGMNAHLAKPIDPKALFQRLYDFIYGQKEDN